MTVAGPVAPPEAGGTLPATAGSSWLRWRGLAWRRLPAWLEVVTIFAGYGAYALVRIGVRASRHTAFVHAAEMWQLERWLHIAIEPSLNSILTGRESLSDAVGYYYGLLHFIVTGLVLAWLYLIRPAGFAHLRSALVIATTAANVVFWTWPLAPPRLAVPGMSDTLVVHHILGAANPHGITGLIDLYAAMPSLHVAWAVWCAVAVVTTTRSRWRHLAWLYPGATTFVVLATANHYVLDTVAGAVIIALGLLVAGRGVSPAPAGTAAPRRVAVRRLAVPRRPVTMPRPSAAPGTGTPAQAAVAATPGAGTSAGAPGEEGHPPQPGLVTWLASTLVTPGMMLWPVPRLSAAADRGGNGRPAPVPGSREQPDYQDRTAHQGRAARLTARPAARATALIRRTRCRAARRAGRSCGRR